MSVQRDPASLPGELWGVTAYFNPAGYATKLSNLRRFSQGVRRQGLKLSVVELAHAGGAFTVGEDLADSVLRVRSDALMWQKERLLNLGIGRLPDACDKVAWLDGDILFTNDAWVEETSRRLEQYRVVQPYDTAVWLPPGGERRSDLDPHLETFSMRGVAFAAAHDGGDLDLPTRPDRAHPGFAWAARRDILSAHGIYDREIIGGGDFVTTSSMYHDSLVWARRSASRMFTFGQIVDFSRWTDAFYRDVRGSVGYVHGLALHLWHGNLADRRYIERQAILRDFDFNPQTDIALDGNGCWSWSSDKPGLHRRVKEYVWGRKEDG